MAKIPVEVDVASEFRYRDPFVDEKTLFIASVSQEKLSILWRLSGKPKEREHASCLWSTW